MADPSCSKPTPQGDRPQSVEALYLPSDNPSNFAVKGWRANPNHFTSVCFSTTAVMCVSNAVVARELSLIRSPVRSPVRSRASGRWAFTPRAAGCSKSWAC